mmetsp:Transcript_79294/g.212650  ORF Transcript_79294/g.212650 Transcript_79294/m.212650 type:complete len:108 (-) Transcript_79294:158-481(-)
MAVVTVATKAQLESEQQNAGGNLVVSFLFYNWCVPCQTLEPLIEEIAGKLPNVKFVRLDLGKIDEESKESFGISSVPHFIFSKNGSKLDEFSGSNIQAIQDRISKYS